MQFTIVHQGVPVGAIDLDLAPDVLAGTVEPLPGYAAIQPCVGAASAALRQLGFLGPEADPVSSEARADALQRGAELGRALELRDTTGALVPTEFIELIEVPDAQTPLMAFVGFRMAAAQVPAQSPPRRGGASDAVTPAP